MPKRDLKIKREKIKGVEVITLPEIKMGETMFCGQGAKRAIIFKPRRMGQTTMRNAMNDPKHKVCKECQFEAQNGHHRTCSQYGGIKSPADFGRAFEAIKHVGYPCPECQKSGRYGTLELLNDKEVARLKEREGKDVYPAKIYGCDECKFWIDAEDIGNV